MLADFAPEHEGPDSKLHAAVLPVLRAAAEEPVLRARYPFTSMFALAFSRTADFPFDHDAPAIWCSPDGVYAVTRSWGPEFTERLWETRDPAAAVRRVVDLMGTEPA
jgi:hypothetical protein